MEDYTSDLSKFFQDAVDKAKELGTIAKLHAQIKAEEAKKQLIESFIAGINDVDDVMNEWHTFVAEQRENDLNAIIAEEKLKPEETRKYIEHAFRDGEIKTSGTDIEKIMPPTSRFGGGGRAEKKQGVIDKLKGFFEKYFGLGGYQA